jgi:hypothetical protein
MSGAPAAARWNFIFLCAVRWFTGQLLCAVRCAPDRHCRLSGAPILGFLKNLLCPSLRPGSFLLPWPATAPGFWRSDLSSGELLPAVIPPATLSLRSSLLPRSVSCSPLPLSSLSLFFSDSEAMKLLSTTLVSEFLFPVKSSETKLCNVSLCGL